MFSRLYPILFSSLYPQSLSCKPSKDKKVLYLTFDDGPIPELTPWVIEVLNNFQAKATFFCVGENVEKHPDLKALYLNNGHTIANHTQNHLKGINTLHDAYLHNVEQMQQHTNSTYFRPPYGKITLRQYYKLKKQYQVVFWDILSKDYDRRVSEKRCLKRLQKARNGSIVVFHENKKAEAKLKALLPQFLEHYAGLGYSFESLPNSSSQAV